MPEYFLSGCVRTVRCSQALSGVFQRRPLHRRPFLLELRYMILKGALQ